ncbi:MAG: 16S rRNA (uracil(1498)-N(3))-methyltransferase [Rhodoferax sp.]|nr:16S rRNA (uracil(1498)-N(3))-methyltransferase [Rhodoferax sp.]MCF8209552.1 16S rRNA (uracil(1498)-N(3))-methyltransferase [Rhodoferax sp.]
MPRIFCPAVITTGTLLDLSPGAARHVQVLRLQPGDAITLFNGSWESGSGGGEFDASITQIGRSEVQVRVGAHHGTEREPARRVHLAVGMPANERMDWLVEKATELGVTSIQPLMTERSVLRLTPERAEKKVAHWQSIAVAACEQCGGNRVPRIWPVKTLKDWTLALVPGGTGTRWLLSLRAGAQSLRARLVEQHPTELCLLSGPEGGLSAAEEDAALACGYVPVALGPRVLRAETAALVALSAVVL